MSNQNEIELINAANKECDRLLAKIDELEKENKTQAYQLGNQGYRIHNQRHEISNRLKENKRLRALLEECAGCVRTLKNKGVSDCNGSNLNDLLTRINAAIGDNKIQADPVADIKIQKSDKIATSYFVSFFYTYKPGVHGVSTAIIHSNEPLTEKTVRKISDMITEEKEYSQITILNIIKIEKEDKNETR